VNLLLSVWTVLVGGIVVEDYVKRASPENSRGAGGR
jgi:hypothetical protein